MPERAVLLFEDETLLRLFPVLRRAWSWRGEQAVVPITGRNEKRVLFGTLNLRTGYRIVLRRPNMRQADFQTFLRRLRRCYPGRQIWLLLDEAPGHTEPTSQALAQALDMILVFLPKQCPELNGMDHLWREVKDDISANYQFDSIEEHADCAENYLLNLSNRQALRRAGILSKDFWLKSFLK
jgi:hypothetical protein